MNEQLPRVMIVGAGFGGLRAARALAHLPVQVTLIDRKNYHLFQPLLYQVATSGLSPNEICYPVRAVFRGQMNLEFRLAEVTAVDLAARQLQTSTGPAAYDYLILAAGGVTNPFGMQSILQHGFGLKSVDDAVAIRNHLLRLFELAAQEDDPSVRQAMLTFVVAGGGPTGVESAGAISELIRLVLARDFPLLPIQDVRVVLLEAAGQLLAGFPSALSQTAAETLWRKHVEVRFGAVVTGFDGQALTLHSGEILPCRTLIWAAGVQAAEIIRSLPTEHGKQGRAKVLPTLQLPEHPEVFVIGDGAWLESPDGTALPMVAPVAMQQADTAAHNIRQLLSGAAPTRFQYRDPGSLATIGRNQAVARLGRWQFTGFVAWVMWLLVHILQLIGFRNRLVVLINWAWDYFLYDRAVRVISPD